MNAGIVVVLILIFGGCMAWEFSNRTWDKMVHRNRDTVFHTWPDDDEDEEDLVRAFRRQMDGL